MAQETQNFVFNSEKSPEFSKLVSELKGGKGRGKSTLSRDIQRALLLYHSIPEEVRHEFTDFQLTLAYLQKSGIELINGASSEYLATHKFSQDSVHVQNTPVNYTPNNKVESDSSDSKDDEDFDREPKSTRDKETLNNLKTKANEGDESSEKLVNRFFTNFDIGEK
ncbi:hypothetical protein [Enterococcus sp. DIV1059_2]|uniref:hypothetical protein n=1 Tax=Enterococcus sp. DIV1059_2 TaxID=2774664 RepID=UPI003F1F5B02